VNEQIQQAQAATQEFMQQHGIDARTMSAVGQMARQAIEDPSMYAMLREQLIDSEVLTKKELPERTNYMTLAGLVSMGVLAEKM